jgi:hypothetical protein
MESSIKVKLLIFSSVLLLFTATNPLHIQALQSSSKKSASLFESISKVWQAVDTTSTQDYYLFAVRAKRGSTMEVGVLSKWFPFSKASAVGRALKTNSRGGKEDLCIQIAIIQILILVLWHYISNTRSGSSFMTKHWTVSRHNLAQGRIYTLLTSSLSHCDPLHLFMNLFVFIQVAMGLLPSVMQRFECKLFLLASGIFSASTSVLVNNFLLGRRGKKNRNNCCVRWIYFCNVLNKLNIIYHFFLSCLSLL